MANSSRDELSRPFVEQVRHTHAIRFGPHGAMKRAMSWRRSLPGAHRLDHEGRRPVRHLLAHQACAWEQLVGCTPMIKIRRPQTPSELAREGSRKAGRCKLPTVS
jgi:hypothetical protein